MQIMKGSVEHKVMIASGAITRPERPKTDWSIGLVAALMFFLLVCMCLAVVVTGPAAAPYH